MTVTSLSVKGQVVIPKAVRETLGLRPGDKLVVLLEGDTIILRPVKRNIADRLHGRYRGLELLSDLEDEHLREVRRESERR